MDFVFLLTKEMESPPPPREIPRSAPDRNALNLKKSQAKQRKIKIEREQILRLFPEKKNQQNLY